MHNAFLRKLLRRIILFFYFLQLISLCICGKTLLPKWSLCANTVKINNRFNELSFLKIFSSQYRKKYSLLDLINNVYIFPVFSNISSNTVVGTFIPILKELVRMGLVVKPWFCLIYNCVHSRCLYNYDIGNNEYLLI